MGRIGRYVQKALTNLKSTFLRFALASFFLACLTLLVSLQIEDVFRNNIDTVTRIILSVIFGAFLGTAFEFLTERFERLIRIRWLLQAFAVLLTALYYSVYTSPVKNGWITIIRLLVFCFALLAFYIWIPTLKNPENFSSNALIHFKSFFISALYSLVLTLGLLAIYFAIDLLLVKLDNKIPSHIANIMGTFFFPVYYLSLLPHFNSEKDEAAAKREAASSYPRFLEILVSYIAIPLLTVFTAVLAVYLLKIFITLKWPAGELGPMILGYSSAGLLLHILCGRLTNRFAVLYRRFFPMALILLVLLQLCSVFIRINAYGITESRYYLMLFGIYSIVCAMYLIATKNLKPGAIAILAACFAILSILPPADAFTVSRTSQVSRVEAILARNNMLSQGKVVPGSNVSGRDKMEITNIMNYMDRMGHISYLKWLPADYMEYRDFDKVFGFSQTYTGENPTPDNNTYFNANADQRLPLDISGFDAMLRAGIYTSGAGKIDSFVIKLGGKAYWLDTARTAGNDVTFTIIDAAGTRLSEFSVMPFLQKLQKAEISGDKNMLPPEKLTFDAESTAFRIRIIFQNISFRIEPDKSITEINGDTIVLVGKK